jgi:anti-anti-sigma regulatory factor
LQRCNAIEFQQSNENSDYSKRHTNILVDLEQVESLDSAGLMALVYGQRLAQV